MAKPALLTVDDDPEVLRAIERDLRRHYAERFRVLRAESGASALEALQQLKARDEPVALLLVDQRMPHMTGVGFLAQAMELYPDAKRVLLTAYADTDAAIRAINQVQIQHYLLKPWDPPEQQLYPVLDDLLDDWLASYRPPFEGIRVVGTRWAPASFAVRDFLGRHQVPFRWLDVELDPDACQLATQAGGASSLPLLLFPDGSSLEAPSPAAIAEKLGLRTRAEKPFYDLVVIGGGPAGLAGAVYGASEGLCTALVEREAPGGQAGQSSRIENYLGFPSGLSGADLTRRAVAQASRFGAEILSPVEATGVRVDDSYRLVQLADGTEVSSHALLIAAGVSYRKLDVPGADRLAGAGVYYGAAMTEATATRGDDVYIVGGANSAGQAAMYFARHARTVTILVRGAGLSASMSQYLIDEIARTANIVVRPRAQVVEVFGEDHVKALAIADGAGGAVERVPASTLFIFIGAQPHTDWLADVVERDEHGFILTGPDLVREGKRPKAWPLDRDPYLLESSVPGIFVAGDVRHGSSKRVASGVGEGSVAISFVHQYLRNVRS
jgi:thioredoxin reductase (NADPH)